MAEKCALAGDGNTSVYQPVTTYRELKQIIKQGGVQVIVSLGGAKANQVDQDRGRQSANNKSKGPATHVTSKSRKKWGE